MYRRSQDYQAFSSHAIAYVSFFRLVLRVIVHLVDGTYELFRHLFCVKGFASRGLVGLS